MERSPLTYTLNFLFKSSSLKLECVSSHVNRLAYSSWLVQQQSNHGCPNLYHKWLLLSLKGMISDFLPPPNKALWNQLIVDLHSNVLISFSLPSFIPYQGFCTGWKWMSVIIKACIKSFRLNTLLSFETALKQPLLATFPSTKACCTWLTEMMLHPTPTTLAYLVIITVWVI